MNPSPVDITIDSPARFEPVQLLVRLVLAIALGFLGVTAGWVACALYIVLPALAAAYISSRGPDLYLCEVAPALSRVVTWLVAFLAYMLLVVDRPETDGGGAIRMRIHPGGRASALTAVLRLVTSLPAALALAVLLVPAGLFAFIGVFTILITRTQPESLLRFQRAVVCYAGRLAAYHASLVEDYPFFTTHGPGARDVQSVAS